MASITCYDGATPVGLLEFVKTAEQLSDPFIHQPSGMIFLPYLLGRFHDVLDLLRNEGPLELYFNPEGKWASIRTAEKEPVGAQRPPHAGQSGPSGLSADRRCSNHFDTQKLEAGLV